MDSLKQQADKVSKVRLTMEHQIIRTQQADKVSIAKDGLGRKNNVRAGRTGQDTSRLHLLSTGFMFYVFLFSNLRQLFVYVSTLRLVYLLYLLLLFGLRFCFDTVLVWFYFAILLLA